MEMEMLALLVPPLLGLDAVEGALIKERLARGVVIEVLPWLLEASAVLKLLPVFFAKPNLLAGSRELTDVR